MKKLVYILTSLIYFGLPAVSKNNIKIGSYNLWRSDIGKGEYSWENRKHRLAKSITECGFDIFGAQEVDSRIQKELPSLISEAGGYDYKWFVFSPYSDDGGTGDKAQAILYRDSRFEIEDSHHFWFSETPEIKSTGWDEQKYFRGGCCAIFRDLKTGRRFFLILAHMPLARTANLKAAEIIMAEASKYNPEGLPAIFLGDLNTTPDSPSSSLFTKYWNDSFTSIPSRLVSGPSGTFNGAEEERNMETARRIDYIYWKGDVKISGYVCNDKKYDGYYPSDHCPIYVNIIIKK